MELWTIWLIAAAVMLTIEVLTQWLVTLCLAVGCLVAMAAALCGVGTAWQIALTAIGAVAAYFILRPFYSRLRDSLHAAGGRDTRTGMEALLGRRATVVDEIRPGELGRARIDGDCWQVRAPGTETVVRRGSTVVVTAFDSIILTVEPLHEAHAK